MRPRFLPSLVLWAVCSASGPALGEPALSSSEELDRQVVALLRAGIDTPVSPSSYAALGPEAAVALIRAFRDSELPRYVRLRALSALQHIPDPRSAAFFRDLLVQSKRPPPKRRSDALDPAQAEPVLRRALVGLLVQRAQVDLENLAPCLEHRSTHVRKVAVRLMALHPSETGRQALTKRLSIEPSAQVRRTIEQALKGPPAPR